MEHVSNDLTTGQHHRHFCLSLISSNVMKCRAEIPLRNLEKCPLFPWSGNQSLVTPSITTNRLYTVLLIYQTQNAETGFRSWCNLFLQEKSDRPYRKWTAQATQEVRLHFKDYISDIISHKYPGKCDCSINSNILVSDPFDILCCSIILMQLLTVSLII